MFPRVFNTVMVLLVAGALIGAPANEPAQRSVRVSLTASDGTAVQSGTVTLRAMMGPQPPITLALASFTQPVVFTVPPHTMWETSVAIKGAWAAPVVVTIQEQDADITIPLLPTGTIAGRIVTPEGVARPKVFKVRVDVPPGAKKLPGPGATETACSVAEDGTFACDVPARTLDLSFHAEGFTPAYRWGVKIEKQATRDIGRMLLSQGSSVSGFVALAGTKIEVGKGKVVLFTQTTAMSLTASRLDRPVTEGSVAPNGFFQLTDVSPGRYVLQASYPGFAPATVNPIEVYSHVESKVKRPIELQPPITLTLRVDPPVDYKGKPWGVQVMRASAVNNKYVGSPVFAAAAQEDGTVILREQPAGRYDVTVKDSLGNPFLNEEFTTSGLADETHALHVQLIRVKGTLSAGDKPLSAMIWFGGHFGDKHVALHSDEDGKFHGILPRDGLWRITINTNTIETELSAQVSKPSDEKDEADLDLRVPSNHVDGRVLDSSDAPVRRASVHFMTDSPFAVMTETDANGTFRFDSVQPGKFSLIADYQTDTNTRTSQTHSAVIGDSDSLTGITLKLQDGRSLHGRVLSGDGPVIGAEVTIEPGNGLSSSVSSSATTGSDGVFDTSVASGFDRAVVIVAAAGYALRVYDVALDGRAITLNLPQAGGAMTVHFPNDINGLFFFQDDRFLSVVHLIHWARSHGESFGDGKSFVHFADISPGRYRACTLKANGGSAADLTRCTDGFLAPYGELQLTIQ